MRSFEFESILMEGALSHAELGKHYGRYLGMFVDKVNNGEPFEVIHPDKRVELGDTVVLDGSAVKQVLQAYFGSNKIPNAEEISADAGGKVIPQADPNKLELKTQTGGTITIGQLRKPPEFGSKKGFNTGQIAEGAIGAAVTARFLKREGEITPADVIKVLADMGAGEESGKNQQGKLTGSSANDNVYFNLVLPKGDYNALYGSTKKSAKVHPDMLGVINSAAQFANSDKVTNALQQVIQDKNANKVSINSDGASDQTGTKADLFLDIDGTTVNLLSLKAGDVKQFGQGSGYTYDKLDEFFNTSFGVRVPKQFEDELEGSDPKAAFGVIHQIYAAVANQIQSELAGDNNQQEARFVERLYKGIRFHATRDDDNVSMVVLKKTPNAPGFVELQFGPALAAAMEATDLTVDYSTPGTGSAIINVMGVGKNGEQQLLVRLRGNFKSEGKGYVRNIVEMGPLLKTLAKIEQKQKQQ